MAQENKICIHADQSVEQTFEEILRADLARAREWEPVALAGEDPEGVHQMRVCLRRVRSALVIFGPAIPRKFTRSFLKELKWAAKTLDRARDLDVYITENLSSKGKERNGKMRRIAMKHREKAYDLVADFIRGERYRRICGEFTQWVEAHGWRVGLSDEQKDVLEGSVTPFSSEMLNRQRARVLEAGMDIASLEDDTLHQLRIKCKKLRYAAEFFAPLYPKEMKNYIRHLTALQDQLGSLHDTTVMRDLQKDLLKNKKKRSLNRYARRLVRARDKQAKTVSRALLESWDGFTNAEGPWGQPIAQLA